MAKSGRFEATANMGRLGEADAVILAAPIAARAAPSRTCPTSCGRIPDVAKTAALGQIVVLESTTYPRTTRDDMLPVLEKSGSRAVARTSSWPSARSREDPKRKDFDTW
ncbi:MAG: hypothetical protein R3B68_14175 [Phycisphaerales bacterium]